MPFNAVKMMAPVVVTSNIKFAMTVNYKDIYYTLRFASAMCFIGHGLFGIIGKKIWLNYFAVFGIGPIAGTHLMPVVGTMDILAGLSLVFYPIRAVAGWLVIWGILTALCRPLSGEPFAEFIERAGNYGAPLALLILCQLDINQPSKWFSKIQLPANSMEITIPEFLLCVRITGFLLLAGHGWLNLIEKQSLTSQYASFGFFRPDKVALLVGLSEILFAFIIFIKPQRSLVLTFFIWKMISELFYPHWRLFEWIERGGSYGVLLALYLAMSKDSLNKSEKKIFITSRF